MSIEYLPQALRCGLYGQVSRELSDGGGGHTDAHADGQANAETDPQAHAEADPGGDAWADPSAHGRSDAEAETEAVVVHRRLGVPGADAATGHIRARQQPDPRNGWTVARMAADGDRRRGNLRHRFVR